MPQGNRGNGKGYRWLIAHINYASDDCLPWPFSRDGRVGRGRVGFKGRHYWAHRLMCAMAHGPAPADKPQAAHSCGNGHLGCVNPRHLSWSTNSQNQLDRTQHGTRNRAKGTRTTLTLGQIAEIRAKQQTQVSLAAKFGVSLGCIQYWLRHDRPPLPPSTNPYTIRRRKGAAVSHARQYQ